VRQALPRPPASSEARRRRAGAGRQLCGGQPGRRARGCGDHAAGRRQDAHAARRRRAAHGAPCAHLHASACIIFVCTRVVRFGDLVLPGDTLPVADGCVPASCVQILAPSCVQEIKLTLLAYTLTSQGCGRARSPCWARCARWRRRAAYVRCSWASARARCAPRPPARSCWPPMRSSRRRAAAAAPWIQRERRELRCCSQQEARRSAFLVSVRSPQQEHQWRGFNATSESV